MHAGMTVEGHADIACRPLHFLQMYARLPLAALEKIRRRFDHDLGER